MTTSQGIMMRLSHFVLGLSLLFTSAGSMAADDDMQGSFHGEVSDGSELVKYNKFIERLKDWGLWAVMSNYSNPARSIPFKTYADTRDMLIDMIEENGGDKIPRYNDDSLKLKGLADYRLYAQKLMSDSTFVASAESCSVAVTYVLPEAVAIMLYNLRPNYIDHPDEALTYAEYAIGNGKDLNSMSALCAAQDKKFKSDVKTFFANFHADIKRVAPDADKGHAEFVASIPPPPPPAAYTANISCGMNGQNYNVLACFKDSELKITTAQGGKLYKVYNLEQAGVSDRTGLHISLPEHFELNAQNSQRTLVLSVSITDSTGKVVYSDQQGQWGVVSVKH